MHYESIVMIRRIDHDNTFLYRCIFFRFFFFCTCTLGGSTVRCKEPALHAGIQSIITVHKFFFPDQKPIMTSHYCAKWFFWHNFYQKNKACTFIWFYFLQNLIKTHILIDFYQINRCFKNKYLSLLFYIIMTNKRIE